MIFILIAGVVVFLAYWFGDHPKKCPKCKKRDALVQIGGGTYLETSTRSHSTDIRDNTGRIVGSTRSEVPQCRKMSRYNVTYKCKFCKHTLSRTEEVPSCD